MTPSLHIKRVVADIFGVSVAEINGPCKKQQFVWARFAACSLIHRFTKNSLPQTGRIMGGRHHTTIMSAIDRSSALYRQNVEYRALYREAFDRVVDEGPGYQGDVTFKSVRAKEAA